MSKDNMEAIHDDNMFIFQQERTRGEKNRPSKANCNKKFRKKTSYRLGLYAEQFATMAGSLGKATTGKFRWLDFNHRTDFAMR